MRANWRGTRAAQAAALAAVVALTACSSGEHRVAATGRAQPVASFIGEIDVGAGTLKITPITNAGAFGALSYEGTLEAIPVVNDGDWSTVPPEAIQMRTVGGPAGIRTRTGGCYGSGDSLEAEIEIGSGYAQTDLRNVWVEVTSVTGTGYNSCLSVTPPKYPTPASGWHIVSPTDNPLVALYGLFQYPDILVGGTGTGTWSFRLPSSAPFTFHGVVWAEKYERTPPVTSASPAYGSYTAPQALTLTCNDTGSGCADTFYTVDGGAQTGYTAPILLSGSQSVCYWSVDLRGNSETPTCHTWNVTMAPATASYDSTLHVPRCASLASACDTGPTLVWGRDNLSGGAELHAPNTLDGCLDGTLGAHGEDEELDRLRIETVDGGPLMAGKQVRVSADVFAAFDSDVLDVFYATTTTNPTWTPLISANVVTTGAVSTLTTDPVTLPTAAVAIRGRFGFVTLFGTGLACNLDADNTDDFDDLVFTPQAQAKGTTPPTVSISSPAANAQLAKGVLVTATASDDVAVKQVEFYRRYVDGGAQEWVSLGVDTSPPWAEDWNAVDNYYNVDLRAVAMDSDGYLTTSATVSVLHVDQTAPTSGIYSPANGATLNATTGQTLTATASDNVAISAVYFLVDGSQVCSTTAPDGNGRYSCDWDATGWSTTIQHYVFARARDYGSNYGQSQGIYVNLQ